MRLLVLGDEGAGPLVDRLQLGGQGIELARLGALDQRAVDDVPLLHAAQAPREGEPAVGRRLAGPAALQRLADGVEPAGDVVGGLRRPARHRPGSSGLSAPAMAACSITAWLVTRRDSDSGFTRLVTDRAMSTVRRRSSPALHRAVAELEGGALEAAVDQVVVERALVLEVDRRLALGRFEQRRLGDVEIAARRSARASGDRRTSAAACGCGCRRRRRRS